MAEHFILSIDQGTTGTRSSIFSFQEKNVTCIAHAYIEFKQYYPKRNWVEHDLEEIWQTVLSSIRAAIMHAKNKKPHFSTKKIQAIGITNQRETLSLFDKKTGAPLHRAIVWQCKRSQDICLEMKKNNVEDELNKRTGLLLDPYFTATKLMWIMQEKPEIKTALKTGRALFGTIDTFLLYKLSGHKTYATEPSNASRTLFFNIEKGEWDIELKKLFQTESLSYPEVRDSVGFFGKTLGLPDLPDDIPICSMLGDQQAALAGHACINPLEAKCTYGTGAFLLVNTGQKIIRSQHKLLTTIAWQINNKITYALEGTSFIAGAAFKFLKEQLNLISSYDELNHLSDVNAAPDVYFVPALSGLGTPYWQTDAEGTIFGLTRSTNKKHIQKAALEGVCFSVNDLITATCADLSSHLSMLCVDGGCTVNDDFLKLQADISEIKIERLFMSEATSLGVALMAAHSQNLINLEDMKKLKQVDKSFHPDPNKKELTALKLKLWQTSVQHVQSFAKQKNHQSTLSPQRRGVFAPS